MPPKPPRHQVDPALYADADGVVQVAVPCAFCSYNLQTLRLGANCPECGKGVGFRFVPELLQNAPLDWLRRVRLGLNLYFLWILFYFVIMVGFWIWAVSYGTAFTQTTIGAGGTIAQSSVTSAFVSSPVVAAFSLALSMVSIVMSLCATWLFTTPRPDVRFTDWPMARVTLRYCAATTAVLFPLWSGVAYWLDMPMSPSSSTISPLHIASSAVFVTLWLVGFVAWWRYIANLLELVPSRRMSRISRVLAWLNVGLFLPQLLFGLMFVLQPTQFQPPPPPPYAMSGGIAPPTSQAATNPAIPPTSQWIYVTTTNNSQIVTTIPAGTPIFTPAMPSRAFMSIGFLSAPILCCVTPVFLIGAVVTIIHIARSLSKVHAIAREQNRMLARPPAAVS